MFIIRNPNKRNFYNKLDVNITFLQNYTNRYTTCQYCGRTLIYSDLYTHLKKFHNYETKQLIIDWGEGSPRFLMVDSSPKFETDRVSAYIIC